MKKNQSLAILESKWIKLVEFVSLNFGGGQKLDLQAILFLIGINELGQGYREFTKEEKTNLLHIAICKLLSRHGYYEYKGKDKDGWPHWLTNKEIIPLPPNEQNVLLKESAISYFETSNIDYKQ